MWDGYWTPKGSFIFANIGYGPVPLHVTGHEPTFPRGYATGRTDLEQTGIILS